MSAWKDWEMINQYYLSDEGGAPTRSEPYANKTGKGRGQIMKKLESTCEEKPEGDKDTPGGTDKPADDGDEKTEPKTTNSDEGDDESGATGMAGGMAGDGAGGDIGTADD